MGVGRRFHRMGREGKGEPGGKEGGKPAPPKPIVIDRYHFKQDIQGYLSDERDHLFLFDIATKKLTRLIGDDKREDKFDERQAEWSPDGKWIAFVSNQEGPDPDRSNNSDVFVVEAKGGAGTNGVATPKKLTSFTGVDGGPLTWSPDSATIAYRQGGSQRDLVYHIQRPGGGAGGRGAAGGVTGTGGVGDGGSGVGAGW